MKKLGGAMLAGALALGLMGCAQSYTQEELASIPQAVVELDKNDAFSYSTWGYYDGSGQLQEFQKCERPEFFGDIICKSEDGVRELSYYLHKSRPRGVELMVDGQVTKLTCSIMEESDFFNPLRSCVPEA